MSTPLPVRAVKPTSRARRELSAAPASPTEEYFGSQPSRRSVLPSPEPLLENLTRCVIEILAGARDLEQISRWVTDDVYRHLLNQSCKPGIHARHTGLPRDGRDINVGVPENLY